MRTDVTTNGHFVYETFGTRHLACGASLGYHGAEANLGGTVMVREKVGRVTSYASAQLVPRAGVALTAEAIVLDYQRWCRTNGFVALRDGSFRQEFARLAARVALKHEVNDADTLYRNVGFVDEERP